MNEKCQDINIWQQIYHSHVLVAKNTLSRKTDGGSMVKCLGYLLWDPGILGSRPVLTTCWIIMFRLVVTGSTSQKHLYSQLICFWSVGILKSCCCCCKLLCSVVSLIVFQWHWKAPMGRDQLSTVLYSTVHIVLVRENKRSTFTSLPFTKWT